MHVSKCLHVSKNHVSPIFLDNYEQNKTKKLLHTFVDIAKETACEKSQRKETLLELELLEVPKEVSTKFQISASLYLKLYT